MVVYASPEKILGMNILKVEDAARVGNAEDNGDQEEEKDSHSQPKLGHSNFMVKSCLFIQLLSYILWANVLHCQYIILCHVVAN